ncbi:MAG: stage III sporulation protein AE [Clostridiales bacterium]|jgi:stage III sporulation protein AE|nr:stage III sporulation protein AE [Clostridiales bacterium]
MKGLCGGKLPGVFPSAKIKSVILLLLFAAAVLLCGSATVFVAGEGIADNKDADAELSRSVEDMIDNIDASQLEELLAAMDESQKNAFGGASVTERLKKIVSGEARLDYGNFFSYLFGVLGINVLQYMPLVISVLGISIAFNIINSVKGRFASDSVESIVHFAGVALIVVLALSQTTALITDAMRAVESMKKQMNAAFPIILTMMAASGANASVAVYQPSVAILSSGVAELISAVVLPCFILSTVFTVVGSLSDTVKLQKMSGFFAAASKWLLGVVFFLFIAFLSIQGITASVYDGVSIRTAKFAVSKYVPVIGGYLSEGLNLVMAGGVLVKNAVGMTAVVLLLLSLAPLVVKIIVFNLSLYLASAIVEPLGNAKISAMLAALSKNTGMLIAVVLGTGFLYFIFLILVISTGNQIV